MIAFVARKPFPAFGAVPAPTLARLGLFLLPLRLLRASA